jgi:hypothetical protein
MQTFFEATANQKALANIGRSMMDFSENYTGLGKLKDEQLTELNELSHVGNMLTHYGAPFGTTFKSFTEADLQLIAQFMRGTLQTQTRLEA